MLPDFHAHSLFSFDSETPLSAYIDSENQLLLTTEHVELGNSVHENRDDFPDFAAVAQAMAQLQEGAGGAGQGGGGCRSGLQSGALESAGRPSGQCPARLSPAELPRLPGARLY
ncbi:hypothetical protein KIM372_15440 [Bombiscardovia nodaiensis]|uniref:Uncharacterized protein n=1 Tax=Bombiscardovia nodaiensis TaxID=2932181 RepID=A0ABM8B9R4_9BIFI|nr:hypothetical protein KIM372_15440 [Bombiscardovia nodaiensis]